MKHGTAKIGSIPDLFRHPTWRRNLLVGVGLGLAGMAGLWGVGFFSPELISTALKDEPQHVVDTVRGYGTALQDVGAFLGIVTFTAIATTFGRRKAFLFAFMACLAVTIYVFNNLRSGTDAHWMLPLMGFAQLSVFGGYAIYFPELFPTRLRGTGVGFCYNTVRYLAAGFPPLLMYVNRQLVTSGAAEPFRTAATFLSFIFVLGLVALIWAPETKGQPLPED
ncbi:MAG: MFS transporter [Opitutaceae bacterium]